MLTKGSLIRIAVNSALGLVLIFVWSRFVNFNELLQILSQAKLGVILPFFAIFLPLAGVLRGLRLKVLLGKSNLPLKDMVALTYLGQMLSFFIPLRVGEVTKSVYLSSQYGLPLGKTVTWIFIDRSLDFLVTLFLGIIFLRLVPNSLPTQLVQIMLVILIGFIITFFIAIKSSSFLKKLIVFLSNILIVPSIKRWFVTFTHNIIDGFEILQRNPFELVFLFALTFMAVMAESLIWFVTINSMNVNFSLRESILGDTLFALTFLVPSAPGYVGSAEAAGLAIFSGVLGITANTASAALLIFHGFSLILIPILGISSLYFLKFDLSQVWKRIKRKEG